MSSTEVTVWLNEVLEGVERNNYGGIPYANYAVTGSIQCLNVILSG